MLKQAELSALLLNRRAELSEVLKSTDAAEDKRSSAVLKHAALSAVLKGSRTLRAVEDERSSPRC